MPFDPTSAVLEEPRFDPSTASADSAYSPEALAASKQKLVATQARLRQLREEADAEDARTKVFVGINAPFSDRRLATFEVPGEIAAFGSEAIKSSPSVAAGAASASAVTPLANRIATAVTPIPYAAPIARFGIPLVAGAVGGLGERFAQDRYLPEILPESLAQTYQETSQIASENPTSAMLGQFAGSAPFFRPGLPIGTTGAARLTVPLITGGISAGIEGANQIAEGEFDPTKLAVAGFGGALFNRETRLGARIAPNLVLPQIAGGAPDELATVGRILREPVLPAPTDIAPAELGIVNQAEAIARQEQGAAQASTDRYVQGLDSESSQRKIRALGERMMGVTEPEQKLQILDQELRLQKDTLTLAEQRAGLDAKLALKQEIDNQRALEKAASDQQKATRDAQKAVQAQQEAIAEAAQPPEIPKSAQILAEPTAKPPSIANVATEVATQTENSPFALQNKLNELTAEPAAPQQITAQEAQGQIATGAPTLEQDIAAHKANQEVFNKLAKEAPDSPEFMEAFRINEEIKNRHGGMPPTKGETTNAIQEQIAGPLPVRDEPESGAGIRQPDTINQGIAEPRQEAPQGNVEAPAGVVTEAEGLAPATREQRLNDAGAELPPVSSLSRAQKRAELDAAGVTTYKGKPLNDINPAELSAAVGKLRRGESLDLPAPDIIDRLTKAKINTRGKQYDATAGIPIAAYNAAIDTAIVAIRAGRALREVIMMAIDRYRKMHPGATEDDITRLSQDIEVAHGYESPRQSSLDSAANATGYESVPDSLLGFSTEGGAQKSFDEQSFPNSYKVSVDIPGQARFEETVMGENIQQALERAKRNWEGAHIVITEPVRVGGRSPESTQAASRLRQTRAAVPAQVLAPIGGGAAGGATGFALTDQQPGESDSDFQMRRLRNTALGVAAGAGAGSLSAMAIGARARIAAEPPKPASRVTRPSPEEGQGVRQLAEKVIEDTNRSTVLRKQLAENPEIIYDKFLLTDLSESVAASTPQELATLRASADRNEQAAATIELANRAAAEGRDTEAANLYAEASTLFTNSAQLLNVAKLVRSPIGYVTAVRDELKALGRVTTPAQETEIARLGKQSIQADQKLATAERAAREDFSHENQKAFEDARDAAAGAKSKLADYVSQIVPKGFDDIIVQTIQGNLLTPLSQIANVYGNILFQPVRRGSMAIASGLDAIYSTARNRPRTIDRTNPLPRMAELEAFADGTKVAAKELLTGPGVDSYVKGEVQRGFRPIRSLIQAFTGKNLARTESGGIAFSDRAKKFIEGTVGAPPEVMFRLLNLGDRGFRRAAEAETLLEQARLRGLKGRALERFLEFPDKATQALLNTEARKAIFAQENAGVTGINTFIESTIPKLLHLDKIPAAKGAIKIFGRLNVPFRQFPLNYVMTALNFAAPELAFGKALYHMKNGDRRKALTNIGEGIMGATMYGAAAYLWQHGLISEPTDKDAKRRSIQYDNMGGQRINISGLQRALAGGDSTWQRDDTTVDWGRMGIPAPVFYVYTADQAKDTKALQQTGVRPPADNSAMGTAFNRIKSYPGIGQFALDQSFLAGSSAFLEALKNGFQGPEADAWAANMFRAGSTLAVPNSVEALARANYQYIPELTGDTLSETVKNIWDFKTFQLPKDDRTLLKRDIWGEPVNRTPPGTNPYVYQFIDVTKGKTSTPDPFKAALVKTFNESNNPGAYPSLPDRSLTVDGTTVKLLPRDYETLQAVVGRLRREEAEPLVLDPDFQSVPAGERVAELEKIYSRAASDAKATLLEDEGFRTRYPALFGAPSNDRVTRRNTAARNRLEQIEPAPVPTSAAFDPATAQP